VPRIEETQPTPSLEVRDLELVLALAEAKTTVRAASRLHVTQSAVSRGLLSLEDRLGVPLFERKRQGLSPTPAGQKLLDGAGPLLAQLVALEQATRAPDAPPEHVRVVCECYTAYRWLPSALRELMADDSRLRVDIAFEHTASPVEALLAGEIDVALLTTARIGRGLLEEPLFSDEIVIVLAPRHPLAARTVLRPGDLRAHTILSSTNTPVAESRWYFGQVFGRDASRVVPRLEVLRLPLTEAVIDAARAGLGLAIMSEWIAEPYLAAGDLVVKRLHGRALRRDWRLAYRPEAAPAARRLSALLRTRAPRLQRVAR
jgi:LysR family transcriptional regulator, regulator for metE and metH